MTQTKNFLILIVDDDAANRRMIQTQLQLMGYASVTANDGAEAVRWVQQQPCDLILMDLDMPELDGLEATRLIRAWERVQHKSSAIPIIAFSGYMHEVDLQRCLEAGMNDGLVKPPVGEKFQQKVVYWLERSQANKSAAS